MLSQVRAEGKGDYPANRSSSVSGIGAWYPAVTWKGGAKRLKAPPFLRAYATIRWYSVQERKRKYNIRKVSKSVSP